MQQINEAKSFRERIDATGNLKNKVITQEELKKVSKNNIEEILSKCKKSMQDGKKYILKLHDENDNNPFGITPLDEYELMKLFKTRDCASYYDKVIILQNNERVELTWNNRFSINEMNTIEVLFEEIQNKDNVEKEL